MAKLFTPALSCHICSWDEKPAVIAFWLHQNSYLISLQERVLSVLWITQMGKTMQTFGQSLLETFELEAGKSDRSTCNGRTVVFKNWMMVCIIWHFWQEFTNATKTLSVNVRVNVRSNKHVLWSTLAHSRPNKCMHFLLQDSDVNNFALVHRYMPSHHLCLRTQTMTSLSPLP